MTENSKFEEDRELNLSLLSMVLNSNTFDDDTETKGFITQTFGRLTVEKQNDMNLSNKTVGYYPLEFLMEVIQSNINIDIIFENYGNQLTLQNTKMKKIVVTENGFNIHFDNFISLNQSDISQIKSIKESYTDSLDENRKKLNEIIENMNGKEKQLFQSIMNELTAYKSMFVF